MFSMLPILAAVDIVRLVVLILVVFFVVASIVKSLVKEMQAISKRPGGSQGLSGQAGSQTAKERLDALAARRREELRRLAQQQSPEPGNLTMAQRVERERARALYQQRAEQLKGYREPAQPSLARQASAASQRTTDPARATAEAARRRAAAQVAQVREVALARRQTEIAAAKRAEEQKRRAAAEAREKERTRVEQPARAADEIGAAKPATASTAKPAAAKGRIPRPTRNALRDALILKEILDPPLALRPPNA